MPSYDEVGQVTMDEIKHFDSDAKDLVNMFHVAGWHTYVNTQGHVFCLAPDGVATASVSRDSLRGRSGRNAAAKLRKWVDDQGGVRNVILSKHTPKKPTSAFGQVVPADSLPDGDSLIMSQRISVAIKRHPVAGPWIEQFMQRVGESSLVRLDQSKVNVLTDSEHPDRWILADASSPPTLVAHSDDVSDDEAMAALREQLPDLFETETKRWEIVMGDDGGQFVCDVEGCGKSFDTAQQLRGHKMLGHDRKDYVCADCGQSFTAPVSLGKHRQREHGAKSGAQRKAESSVTACRWCGRSFDTSNGRGIHEAKAHAGEPMPEVAITMTAARPREVKVPDTGDVTVTSPPVTAAEPTGDVLMDHLMGVPDGDDAEAIVAKIRAVVSAPLVGEVRRLRDERDRLVHENELLTKQVGELEARMAILREAMSV